MSLRIRLLLLFGIAAAALLAVMVGGFLLILQGDTLREGPARTQGELNVETLTSWVHGLPRNRIAQEVDRIRPVLSRLAATLNDGSVGLCSRSGELLIADTVPSYSRPESDLDPDSALGSGRIPSDSSSAARSSGVAPRAPPVGDPANAPGTYHGRPHNNMILPLDRHAIEAACRGATSVNPITTRRTAPTDVLLIATSVVSDDLAAFSLVRLPRAGNALLRGSFPWVLAMGGIIVLLLFGLTAHTLSIVRRSAEALAGSVASLDRDLRARIELPPTRELAEVAVQLQTMAHRLADAQERERELATRLEEQRRLAALGRVAAGVAHEVRNPLAGIKLRLDSMFRRSLDDRSKKDVHKCLMEVERLDRVVRSLLLMARKAPLASVPVDLNALLQERLDALGGSRVKSQVKGLVVFQADPDALGRVIDNLVNNAVDASPDDAPVLVTLDANAAGIALDVADQGPGVPASRLQELFEPFFTTKSTGTGLGLALARAVVEAHGGTLNYERREDSTHFIAHFPLHTSS